MEVSTALYLDLMKRCLTNWVYGDTEEVPCTLKGPLAADLAEACTAQNLQLRRPQPFDPEKRVEGLDWPPHAHTMIGLKRLENLQACVQQVLEEKVPGDLIETGVWRGGATIFMRAILKAYGVCDRRVWVADSFEGLPPPNSDQYPCDTGDLHHTCRFLAVSLEQVRANFARYGLLDEQVRFLKGWFRDTLPAAPISRLAVARLDGDMYESTIDALSNLYPRLSVGGFLIVDDYGCLPPCKQAVQDYRAAHGIEEPIIPVDWTGIYWRRTQAA